nr:tetratricopeptide repeat protein [Ancylobacter oerskovii]
MKEGRLRASAPAATSTARSLPAEPTPDDITGSVSPRPAAPPATPEAPAGPELPALPAPPAPLPGSSSLDLPLGDLPLGDLPGAIGSQGLRVAAQGGDPAAAYEVAHRFLEGDGIPPSTPRAVQWFGFAAAHGSIPAAYRLGALYEKGTEGLPRDLARARAFYEAAAGGGNVRAMHNLGVLLADGTTPDYAGAAVWFQKAAGYGVRDSQYNLGVLYARGYGVEADQVQAWRWFALAAQRGDQEAGLKRDEIAARLDADTLATARKALQLWTPAVVDAKANSGSGLPELDLAPARKTASRS